MELEGAPRCPFFLLPSAALVIPAKATRRQRLAARALGSIDLFIIWWIVSLAIGLGVLYKKRTGPIASSFIAVYVSIGLIIAAIRSAV